jgi:lycopene cyclase domain-containing protein
MLETKWLYLLLNLGTISVPLLRSFEPKVAYYKSFPRLFKGILIVGGFFLVWDIYFTSIGVWGFTPTYLSGIELFGLPLGEYLFFITVPFACVFIYRVLQYFFPKGWIGVKTASKISTGLIAASLFIGLTNLDKWYTASTFLLLAMALIYVAVIKKEKWLGRFYDSYLVALLPFFVKNGILTGSFLKTQVVWYNNAENLGIRMFTIPFEDVFYGMLLILGVIYFYEAEPLVKKTNR